MTRKTDGGKGSRPRPIPDRQGYEANWDRIFGVKDGLQSLHGDAPQDGEAHGTGPVQQDIRQETATGP